MRLKSAGHLSGAGRVFSRTELPNFSVAVRQAVQPLAKRQRLISRQPALDQSLRVECHAAAPAPPDVRAVELAPDSAPRATPIASVFMRLVAVRLVARRRRRSRNDPPYIQEIPPGTAATWRAWSAVS